MYNKQERRMYTAKKEKITTQCVEKKNKNSIFRDQQSQRTEDLRTEPIESDDRKYIKIRDVRTRRVRPPPPTAEGAEQWAADCAPSHGSERKTPRITALRLPALRKRTPLLFGDENGSGLVSAD